MNIVSNELLHCEYGNIFEITTGNIRKKFKNPELKVSRLHGRNGCLDLCHRLQSFAVELLSFTDLEQLLENVGFLSRIFLEKKHIYNISLEYIDAVHVINFIVTIHI